MSEIEIAYYGHSCFKVCYRGNSILFDPYEDFMKIRVRIDGSLSDYSEVPNSIIRVGDFMLPNHSLTILSSLNSGKENDFVAAHRKHYRIEQGHIILLSITQTELALS